MTSTLRWPNMHASHGYECVVDAPAKLNLTLAVRGKRPDGFHDLCSLVVGLDWCDTIHVTAGQTDGISLTCEYLESLRRSGAPIPADSSNLAWQAAALLAERLGRSADISIRLQKRIPAGAGLGGGSSDAAATLKALNRLWNANLGLGALTEIGTDIGSDVPLFFHLPAAVIAGRGERVQPISVDDSFWVLLVLPELHVSTATVFSQWDQNQAGKRSVDRDPATQSGWENLLKLDARTLSAALFNDLEQPAFQTAGPLRQAFDRVVGLGLERLRVTGSGSGMFHLFSSRAETEHWAARIENTLNLPTRMTRTLNNGNLKQGDFYGNHRSTCEADSELG